VRKDLITDVMIYFKLFVGMSAAWEHFDTEKKSFSGAGTAGSSRNWCRWCRHKKYKCVESMSESVKSTVFGLKRSSLSKIIDFTSSMRRFYGFVLSVKDIQFQKIDNLFKFQDSKIVAKSAVEFVLFP
jgi:hypothetical protein